MPIPGVDFPKSEEQFRAWFQDDDACLDYLDWLRWGNSLVCTSCGIVNKPRPVSGRIWRCSSCTAKVSRTTGTIFQDTRTPMTIWFAAAWEFCMDKGGVSALTLKRRLNLGSYETAWTMLHRYRSAMALAGIYKLKGTVEVDETFLGGVRPGVRGRGALGKVLVIIAVERQNPKGYGRARMKVIPDATAGTIKQILLDNIEVGSTVITDGHRAYPIATKGIYIHQAHAIKPSGKPAHTILPAVHRVASLLKRWFLGTYQGSFGHDHLDAYLSEFTFRWNRRKSRYRGLIFYRLMTLAVQAPSLTYDQIVKKHQPKSVAPVPPTTKKVRSNSLSIPEATRPWRESTPTP